METQELKGALKEIILSLHRKGIPEAIEREVETPEFEKINKVIVVTGPRRAGKTYFLYGIMKRLIGKGSRISDIVYINFEDDRISGIRAGQLNLIAESYSELYPGNKPIFFLDEIQNVDGWEKFARRLNDNRKISIISILSTNFSARRYQLP